MWRKYVGIVTQRSTIMANKCSSKESLQNRKRWQETIHVNVTVLIQLFSKFHCQLHFLLSLAKRKQVNKLPKMKRWQETIHVNVTVLLQLLSKFRYQHLVHFWWEIAQCIGQSFLKEKRGKTILKNKVG